MQASVQDYDGSTCEIYRAHEIWHNRDGRVTVHYAGMYLRDIGTNQAAYRFIDSRLSGQYPFASAARAAAQE